MKQETTAKYVLRLALTLLIITSVVAACLAGVNSITEAAIAQQNAEKIQQAVSMVLPGGGQQVDTYTDETGLVSAVYASDSGYAVEVRPVGFNDVVTMMVGVDKSGAVLGISIVSHTESAGLGAEAAASNAAGEAFRTQFVGMSGEVAVTKDGGSVNAISGATITSRGVCTGVNAALACVANMG